MFALLNNWLYSTKQHSGLVSDCKPPQIIMTYSIKAEGEHK